MTESSNLRIIVNEARGLMKKDIFGLSDPYVVIYQEELEDDEDIADIKTHNHNLTKQKPKRKP